MAALPLGHDVREFQDCRAEYSQQYPRERDRTLIEAGLRNELISAQSAQDGHGWRAERPVEAEPEPARKYQRG
jgi:hypothetical protein